MGAATTELVWRGRPHCPHRRAGRRPGGPSATINARRPRSPIPPSSATIAANGAKMVCGTCSNVVVICHDTPAATADCRICHFSS
jgi:hypothetical protein